MHSYFVYTRPADGNSGLFDQYRAEAINPNFPFDGMLVGQHFLMERGLTASEVEAKRRDGNVIVAKGEDLLPVWRNIVDSVNRLNEARFVYRIDSNNSNAFVNTALRRAGLRRVEPFRELDQRETFPGLDVLLDLRPLGPGEVDKKPEDRQLKIIDDRPIVRGNPAKNQPKPKKDDGRKTEIPSPPSGRPSLAAAGLATQASAPLPLSRVQSSTIQLGAATSKHQSPPSDRPRKWPYDGNPIRVRIVWKPGQSTLVAAQRALRQIKDAAAAENVQLKLESERWVLSKIQQGIARGKGRGIWFDHDFWFKVVYPGEPGY